MKKIYLSILSLTLGIFTSTYAQTKKELLIPQGTPVVDGIIDEAYGDISKNLLTNFINFGADAEKCAAAPGTPNPNNVTVGATWDDSCLYVIMKVIDATPNGNEDAAEIFIALEPVSTPCADVTGPNGIYGSKNTGTSSEQIYYKKLSNTAVGSFGAVPSFPFKSTNTSDGYIFEAKMRLTGEFGLGYFLAPYTPQVGTIIGIDFANANNAVGGGKNQSMWNQCCGNRNWARIENYGVGKFVPTITGTDGTNSLNGLVNKMTVYPNPAAGKVNVKIDAVANDNVNIALINSLSQKVYTGNQALAAGVTNHEINTENLANGIYTVVISKGNLNTTEMVVINK